VLVSASGSGGHGFDSRLGSGIFSPPNHHSIQSITYAQALLAYVGIIRTRKKSENNQNKYNVSANIIHREHKNQRNNLYKIRISTIFQIEQIVFFIIRKYRHSLHNSRLQLLCYSQELINLKTKLEVC
jgi:hypothetical protein